MARKKQIARRMNYSFTNKKEELRSSKRVERKAYESEQSRSTAIKRIPVLLVGNFTIVRQGLRLLVEAAGDIEVVAEAKTEREAIQMTHALHPEVVVMDIVMPFLSGSQVTRRILKSSPSAKVLILSAPSDADYVEHIAKAGASGYVVKEATGEVLARAIRELHMGNTFFTPAIARRFEGKRQQLDNGMGMRKRSVADLTSREAEVLPLIAEGHVNKEIASELGISIKTVEKHRQHLMQKLDIHHIAGLTHFAIASGVVACSV